MREKVADKDQRARQMRENLEASGQQLKLMREQLVTNGHEIDRLRKLNHQQLADRDQKISELSRQLREVASGAGTGERNGHGSVATGQPTSDLYLDLMKRTLTDSIYSDGMHRAGVEDGDSWPSHAHSMIGLSGLDNLQSCVEDVLANDVPGDFIETGVWRGGSTIFMRAILKAHGVTDRRVWVADSFEGLPTPDVEKYPHDAAHVKHAGMVAVSLEQVQANFERYGLLDGQVRFLKGWFSDTLPDAPLEELAVVRLDGDLYESTMDALSNLYPKLSVGGYLIIDDYGAVPACRQAIHDYREEHGITEEIVPVNLTVAYWQRTK
jgi:hypothetical protein